MLLEVGAVTLCWYCGAAKTHSKLSKCSYRLAIGQLQAIVRQFIWASERKQLEYSCTPFNPATTFKHTVRLREYTYTCWLCLLIRLVFTRSERVSCELFPRFQRHPADPVDDSVGLYDGLVAPPLPPLTAADTSRSGLRRHGPAETTDSSPAAALRPARRWRAARSPSKKPDSAFHGTLPPSWS